MALWLPPQGQGTNDPPHDHETYIVQFPKDQVYYVPPPENALIVENFRNPQPKNVANHTPRRRPRFLTIALLLLSVVALLAITLTALYFIFKPTTPTFSVTDIVVKNPPSSAQKSSRPRYQISLMVNNPNKRSVLKYVKNADVFLLSENTRVATGKFPWLEQEPDASTKVKVELRGWNGPMPRQMEKSMHESKSNIPISFDLEMKLGIKAGGGGLNIWDINSNVACKFKVSTLRNNTRLLSQECNTKS